MNQLGTNKKGLARICQEQVRTELVQNNVNLVRERKVKEAIIMNQMYVGQHVATIITLDLLPNVACTEYGHWFYGLTWPRQSG